MFTYIRNAKYYETDQMGIIHHSNYVRWMEEARIAFMNNAGYPFRIVEEKGIVSPVVNVSVNYRKPVLFDDNVEIRVDIVKYDGVLLELSYEFYNQTRCEICTTATSRHCFTKAGKIISIKKELPEIHEKVSKYRVALSSQGTFASNP